MKKKKKKKKIMISKLYAKSLSKDELVYACDEDPEESIVIHRVYPNNSYRVFGMKTVVNIGLLFIAILRL